MAREAAESSPSLPPFPEPSHDIVSSRPIHAQSPAGSAGAPPPPPGAPPGCVQGVHGNTQGVHRGGTEEIPYSTRMRRLMLRFLQKRKFRLVTRWKAALKGNIGFQVPSQGQFPYTLIFRAFDDIVRLLKMDSLEGRAEAAESFLAGLPAPVTPTADQYMELFLTGRDVLGEFVEADPSFCALFSEEDRRNLRGALERVFKYLVDREMREYTRRFSSSFPG